MGKGAAYDKRHQFKQRLQSAATRTQVPAGEQTKLYDPDVENPSF